MNYTCSNTVIKYLMFTINFIFVITGIIIIAVGVSAKSNYSDYDILLDSKYFTLPNMLIATGSLIFFISFLGCFGAMRENWMMLMAFAVCLTIIFIFELSVGIAGYVLRDKTSSYLEQTLSESMKHYTENPKMWDTIQIEFKCCGVGNYSDWRQIFNNDSLPTSCCPAASGTVGVFYCNANPTPLPPQPTEPTKPTEPTEPTEPPTEPTEPPTEPSDLAERDPHPNAHAGPNVILESLVKADDDNNATTPGETSGTSGATDIDTTDSTDTDTTVSTDKDTTDSTDIDTTDSTDIDTTVSTDIDTTVSTDTTPTSIVTPETTRSISTSSTERTETTTNVTPSTAYPPSSSEPYSTGCETAFGDFIKKHAVDIGSVGIALAVIQIFGIALSFHMARQLKNGYYST